MRWAHEHDFDAIVNAAASDYAIEPALILGVIAHESAGTFNPAIVGDDGASIGLMQVQPQAAADAGYPVTVEQLKDAETNIYAGTAYLAKQIDRANGDVNAGLSAYNGGWRPSLGFGAVLPATGKFKNQAYVDSVQSKADYFRAQVPPPVTDTGSVDDGTDQAPPPAHLALLILTGAGILGLVAWLALR